MRFDDTLQFDPVRRMIGKTSLRGSLVALPARFAVLLLGAAASACGTQTVPTQPGAPDVAQDAAGTDTVDSKPGADVKPSDAVGADLDTADVTTGFDGEVGDTAVIDAGEVIDAPADLVDATDAADPGGAEVGDDADTAIPVDTDTAEPVDADTAPEDVPPIGKSTHTTTCVTGSDCNLPCATGVCLAGYCKYTPKPKACVVDLGGGKVGCFGPGDAGDDTPCLACWPAQNATNLSAIAWLHSMDGEADVVLKDTADTKLGWNWSDKRAKSGNKALYFGDPKTYTYANGKTVAGTAMLPEAKVPGFASATPRAAFWLWLDTEEFANHDVLSLAVVADGKVEVVWKSDAIKGSTFGAWRRIEVELGPWAGKKVALQFAFDSKDAVANTFEGAYVDDVMLLTGCCAGKGASVAGDECDDGNACSDDSCDKGPAGLPVCAHKVKSDCCNSAGDCDDGKICTVDLCPQAGSACTHQEKPGCCLADKDCDDGKPLTIDKCFGSQCQNIDTSCKSDGDCKTADPCQKGVCAAGLCSFTSTCCLNDGECDDFNPCTQDGCDKGKCVHTAASVPGCCSPTPLSNKFDGGDEGWASDPVQQANLDWHWKAWDKAKSLPGALHFGDKTKDAQSFPNTTKVTKLKVAVPAVTVLPGKETSLTFQYLPNLVGVSGQFRFYMVLDGVETPIANLSMNNGGFWQQMGPYDLTPLGGKTVQFYFDVTISFVGIVSGTGLWIDDFIVASTCKPKTCASSFNCPVFNANLCVAGVCTDGQCTYANNCCKSNADCNDNNLCTQDMCQGTKCAFTAIPKCCMGPGDCEDNNACTTNVCPAPGQICQFPAVPACCLSSSECDDKNACTKDLCILNKCKNENTCCKVDKDCDDGETKCTVDKCVAQTCVHQATNAPGCCEPIVYANDFDGGDPKGIVMQSTTTGGGPLLPTQGWQLWGNAAQSKSGKGVLYYGDPTKQNFDFGATKGTAKTGKIQLPAATPSEFKVWLYYNTEDGGEGSYDDLKVLLNVDGQQVKIWTKSSPNKGTNKWIEIKYDLKAYMGKEVQFEFYFNTLDSIGNNGLGVLFDDLQVVTACN